MDISEVNKLLNQYSTSKYYITFDHFKANHVSHGIAALYKLGASKRKITSFVEWYCGRLNTPNELPAQVKLPDHLPKDVSLVLGKRIAFYPICEFYEDVLKQCDSVEQFIAKCFLPKAIGMIGGVLHPVIHMGYGIAMGNTRLIIEGMAYQHHSYIPWQFKEQSWSIGQGSTPILDILDEVRNNEKLRQTMVTKATEDNEWFTELGDNLSDFCKRSYALCSFTGDVIASYVSRIKMPEWFNKDNVSSSDVLKLMDWVLDCAITVYQASSARNDFFLLHGVTGAWCLRQILAALGENHIKESLFCVQIFLCSLLAVYVIQDSPTINQALIEERTEKSWQVILEDAKKEQFDEHVYKLVQVCYERSQKTEEHGLLKAASLSAINWPFSHSANHPTIPHKF